MARRYPVAVATRVTVAEGALIDSAAALESARVGRRVTRCELLRQIMVPAVRAFVSQQAAEAPQNDDTDR